MSNTKVIIFTESSLSRTFLFECSRYWASEGYPVHYVSKNALQNFPRVIQGVRVQETYEIAYKEFEKITFVTAPLLKDFMEYMTYLRKLPRIPKAIVVENISVFFEGASESEVSLLCSFLKHTADFCSRAHDNEASLIISSKFDTETLNMMNFILLPHKIWQCDEPEYDENAPLKYYLLRELSLNPLCTEYEELKFSSLGKDCNGRIRLNSISRLFDKNLCDFSAKIS